MSRSRCRAGIAVDDRLDLRDRRLVVDRRIEADPELGEVDADDLVGDLGAADVRAEVAHAGTARSSLLALSVIRRIASSDVPGFSTQCIRKSYSLKCGRNSSPRNGNATAVDDQRRDDAQRPARAATRPAASAGTAP